MSERAAASAAVLMSSLGTCQSQLTLPGGQGEVQVSLSPLAHPPPLAVCPQVWVWKPQWACAE